MIFSLIRRIFGSSSERTINKFKQDLELINALEAEISSLSDKELQGKTDSFKQRIKNKETLDNILHEAFAVVREASKRVLQMRHFDSQILGGIILHKGMIAEMGTGEGKTLVATLPVYLNALLGKGVHVVTVNDYLARRDAETMSKIYNFLGLSVGCIIPGLSNKERKAAYNADITHATNNELGFDYLKDNMQFSLEDKVQRGFNFAIIDEMDSILIDESRTPLIISGPVSDRTDLYSQINSLVRVLNLEEDYLKDEKTKNIHLTDQGINKLEAMLSQSSLINLGSNLYDLDNMHLLHYINQSLKAHNLYHKDVDYIVKNDQVLIIDEFTGRILEGRRYSEGLHQAIEAKELVPIQNENQTLASITFQNYFRMYEKIAGMTGTAMTESAEFKEIYNLEVVSVPPNKTSVRIDHNDDVYGTNEEKYHAILNFIKDKHARGQPILVGTISVEKSEAISELLAKENIKHSVLNAKYHEKEAHIIAQAGKYKAITIATNMAGRGTDILLGGNLEMILEELNLEQTQNQKQEITDKITEIKAELDLEKEKVMKAGGLVVIGTERHESRRIDNQLRGRSARQGDPGETKFFLSLEDDLLRIFASDKIAGMLRSLGLKGGEAINHPIINKSIERAQKKVETHNYEIRKNLLKFDDVVNTQRNMIYDKRNQVMNSESLRDTFLEFKNELVEEIIQTYIPAQALKNEWRIEDLIQEVQYIFNINLDENSIVKQEITTKQMINALNQEIDSMVEQKIKDFSEINFNYVTKYIFLGRIDQLWKEHLNCLDNLRQGIVLRAYGQKDPLNEYKKESFAHFENLFFNLKKQFVQSVCHIHMDLKNVDNEKFARQRKEVLSNIQETRDDPAINRFTTGITIGVKAKIVKNYVEPADRESNDPETWGRVARNEICPCGSKKKYKHCHGSDAE